MKRKKIPNKIPQVLEELATDYIGTMSIQIISLLLLAYQKGYEKGLKSNAHPTEQ